MKKMKLSEEDIEKLRKEKEEELEKLKKKTEEDKALQDSILFETEALTQKELDEKNKEREKEKINLLGGGQTSIYSRKELEKMLFKNPAHRGVTFIKELYDEWFRLTGLKRSDENPQQKPLIFAQYTLDYIYGRFKIINLIDELRERNPFITFESLREFKHYQFLKDESYYQLLGFIDDVISLSKECSSMHEFDFKYRKKYNLAPNGYLF